MSDEEKTQAQLAQELAQARERIAELERVAEENKREAKLFRRVLESSPETITLLSAEGTTLYQSPATEAFFGYASGEMTGINPFELIHPDDLPKTQAMFVDLLQKPQDAPITAEFRFRHADGSWILIEDFARNLLSDPDVGAILLVSRDLTKQRQMEAALMQERDFSNAVISSLPGVFYLMTAEGKFLRWNDQLLRVLGLSAEEIAQIPALEIVKEKELVAETMQRILTEGEGGAEAHLVTRDGDEIPYYFEGLRVVVDREAYIIGTGINISERKRAEAERERLQQEVIEAQRQALRELSTPIIPVMEGIIVMPLIGSIDTMRSKDIMRTLMQGISAYRAKVVILDITGVPLVDSGVADHLNKTIQAARLKGTRTIVTGVSDAVAETIVDLGIDWGGIETLRDLQTGLVVALGSLGFKLSGARSL